jgi:rfaE bifunctional protein nucleotidyltransferase chain/domain
MSLIIPQLLPLVRERYPKPERIVLATGCFDIVHEGHRDYLETAKALGGVLVVAVLNDQKVRERKGEARPIRSEQQRAETVDGMRPVDFTFVEPYDPTGTRRTMMSAISALQADVLAVDDTWESYREEVEDLGTKLHALNIEKRNSTSNIIAQVIAAHAIEQAAKERGVVDLSELPPQDF